MNRERWQRVEEIFHAALERSDAERATFVEQACAGDTNLQQEVAGLLAYDDPNTSFIERPALEALGAGRENGPPFSAGLPTPHTFGAGLPTPPLDLTEGLTTGQGDLRSAPWTGREIRPQQGTRPQQGIHPQPGSETAEATLLSDTPPDAPRAADELPAGHQIQNHRIVRKIGAGGMGEVYLAENLRLGRRVALKLLPGSLHVGGKGGRRFLREARAASALNHSNIVTIYNADEADGLSFIEMEYIEGESLRDRLARGPLELPEVIALGLQAADAAAAAHAINIVHRDLKPGNILFTASGQAKIVDFGLAKVADVAAAASGATTAAAPTGAVSLTSVSLSQAGSVSGTVPYMSPEQTRGEHIDARSDIFSLGCVLYEAATGRRPFDGTVPAEIIHQIREVEPARPSSLRPGLPRGLDAVILRALAKDKTQRFGSAGELAVALRTLQTRESARRFVKRAWVPGTAAIVLIAAAAVWWQWKQARIERARQDLAAVEGLINAERYFEGHDLLQQAAASLPDDAKVRELRPWVTDVLSVTTEPPGAEVFLRRYQRGADGEFPPPEFIGRTPIHNLSIARGDYVVRVEKEGYRPFRRTISSAIRRFQDGPLGRSAMRHAELLETEAGRYNLKVDSDVPITIAVNLLDSASSPEGMVFVPGGTCTLRGWGRPTEEHVTLDDYFIDQYEVTNRAYKAFVDAGSYANREYWKHPFRRLNPESETLEDLSWEEGIALLVDVTGKPGPRSWSQQGYPAGTDDHPVTDVTWYEAAAYAEFRGKGLPTVFQWERAAREDVENVGWGITTPWGLTGPNEDIADRLNGMGAHGGTTPVGRFEFGLSPWGCYDMAGNVEEWCANPRPLGFTTAASSWNVGAHLFGRYGQFPGFYSSGTLGFRCVHNLPGASGDQGGMPLPDADKAEEYSPVAEDDFQLLRAHYDYDRPRPEDALVDGQVDRQELRSLLLKDLDVQIIEEVQTDDWTRVKISFVGAEGQRSAGPYPDKQRALAYLWLPKNARPPYQVVNYKPGGPSYSGVTVPQETEVVCGAFLLNGRALFVTVIRGMRERDLPADWQEPDMGSVAHREMMAYDTLDQRRGLDYLETRDDIDMDKIACLALSAGSFDLVTIAVEDRFRAVCLLSAGLGRGAKRTIAAANPVNFAPYIKGPKLMIHGRYDEGIPFKTGALPLYELLSEPKEHVWLESGHFPALDQWVPPAQVWLDKVLGPVETSHGLQGVAQRRP